MNQKLREILVFSGLFSLPFASAFFVQWWATFLLCPLGVIGLVGLNDTLGALRWPSAARPGGDRS
jgi:hypothetical protein